MIMDKEVIPFVNDEHLRTDFVLNYVDTIDFQCRNVKSFIFYGNPEHVYPYMRECGYDMNKGENQ